MEWISQQLTGLIYIGRTQCVRVYLPEEPVDPEILDPYCLDEAYWRSLWHEPHRADRPPR